MTSDAPAELIESGIYTAETASAAGQLMVRSEYMVEDFNSFAALAARRTPVGILDHATRGRPERSTRYRDLLEPSGIPFELRAAFLIRGRAWGAVHMARRENSGAFTQRDVDTLALAAPAIAHGIRASLRFDAARRAEGPEAPGLIVLDAENNVELITPPAYELLDAIRSDAVTDSRETPPNALLGLASFARRNGSRADPGANVITVPSARGWIRLHASLIAGSAAGKVAIFMEPASGPHSPPCASRSTASARASARSRHCSPAA